MTLRTDFSSMPHTHVQDSYNAAYYYFAHFLTGYPESFREVRNLDKDSVVFLDAEDSNLSFKTHCYSAGSYTRQYENFQIMTKQGRYPILDVIYDVTSWQPGELSFK